ncbi:MAG: hypothetical protein NXY57DRAFT_1051754 [Lentinula lateritia]|nr:MAG: hypothetical protein NXY57DRAFT_1051754 [Lentinula lateritia]
MKQCNLFLVEQQMITEGTHFFCDSPHPQAAVYIVAWIMHSCDEINLNGSPIATNVECSTYAHAQKMRAAATFGFGQIHGLGMQAWHQSEISGKMLGNASVSETVSSYMLSLRCRKVSFRELYPSGKFINYLIFSVLLNNLLDIKPFVWDEMPEEYQHICVVRAFSRWVLLSGLTEGYLFCKIRAGDRIYTFNYCEIPHLLE